ncbi:MAG: hemin receptor [gamma proteobacterium symbiont of Bathyaustriella thionipta]|nr:hemin receptor [gamma proteobacterium symbiont of Bathyaustriella thionipta]MCU7951526.1 hemin receptor [gamma proteobacterium symbiont of Bathyaustriella thionipta]MCU7958099.1 hemin receptor [gamma proteobacterium symbiont of Bathyaustriella thionipta]MCU7965840.1 hemin receptor [gamma proteobacterium symbiont of Bathyaustriella thionipta]
MTPEQKSLVRCSWKMVKPISEQAAEIFYGRLFSEYPEVKTYFKGDMKEQGKKLMSMINAAVSGIDDLESLLQPIAEMGARHVDYGVKDEDYDKVGAALLWTLEQALGPELNEEIKEAWIVTYATVANVMKEGAKAVA